MAVPSRAMLPALFAALALGAPHDADLNALFAAALPQVKAKTTIPVLLPDAMPTEMASLYPSSFAARRSYSLGLAGVPDCGGANACFEADFSARKGGRPYGPRTATLARGRHGRFKPLTCGGSCSPPSMEWKERGVTYRIQANVGDKRTERRILVRMANQAIRRGPR
jgi:hypothetical protein